MRRKIDYQKKNFKNPFFNIKPGQKKKKFKIYLILLIIALISGLYYLSASKNFTITNIEISGNQTTGQQVIASLVEAQFKKRRFFIFPQQSIFFFNTRQAKNSLSQQYIFDSLKVKKKYYHTIAVEIQEKAPALIWVSGPKKYYLEKNGTIIKEIIPEEVKIQTSQEGTAVVRVVGAGQENYPLVYDQSNSELTPGKIMVKEELIDFILDLDGQIKKGVGFEAAYYSVPGPFLDQVDLLTSEGWQAYFRITEPAEIQLKRLSLILREKTGDRSKLEYVDLRFGEKVYYK